MPTERTKIEGLKRSDHRSARPTGETKLLVTIASFGYKEGPPPPANVVFDVRFLKNPFWVPELRSLTGLDEPVRKFVLGQPAASEFLDSFTELLSSTLPRFVEQDVREFTIALGCTGGQHRSVALVETLAEKIEQCFPEYQVVTLHRELVEERA